MADCSPSVSQQTAEINALNSKLAYDSAAQLQHQSLVDNQVNARALQSLQVRASEDAQTIKHLAALNVVTAAQTGQTENQQTVTPIRTGAGDAIAAVPGVAAGQISANIADLATSLVPVIASALASAIATAVTALLPVTITAAGGASTPSQTQPKP